VQFLYAAVTNFPPLAVYGKITSLQSYKLWNYLKQNDSAWKVLKKEELVLLKRTREQELKERTKQNNKDRAKRLMEKPVKRTAPLELRPIPEKGNSDKSKLAF